MIGTKKMRNAQTTYKPGASQNCAFTNAHAEFALTDKNTTIVRLVADQNCHVTLDGTNAAATSMKLVSGLPEYFSVDPSASGVASLSVIRDSADGTLNVTEMTQ